MSTVFEFKRSVAKSKTAKLLEILDKFKQYEDRVAKAVKEKKIYKFVYAWDVPRVKMELAKRGFIETVPNPFYNLRSVLPMYNLIDRAENFNDYEQALLCKILGDVDPNYVWTEQPWCYDFYSSARIVNKMNFGKVNFWLKDGSCHYIRAINSQISKYKNRIKYPRSYDVINHRETKDFQKDYRFTAATSLVLFLNEQEIPENYFSKDHGQVYYNALEFALEAIEARLKTVHSTLKDDHLYKSKTYHHQWKKVFKAHRAVVVDHQKIIAGWERMDKFIERIRTVSRRLLRYFPGRYVDGTHNLWMLKPTYSGEGRGIILCDTETEVLKHINENKDKQWYIVQKYIERPLLVYATKFDIRQYWLVSVDKEYLRCWYHPVMSVKFASEEFSLEVFDETIHLTNAAIQIKYKKKSNPNLPAEHLWTLGPLVSYMERMYKRGHSWEDDIVPAMKRAISNIFLQCVSEIVLKPGRYELFGNDWIITDDFETYLLEINRPPSLSYYSPVSEIVCGAISEDCVRVSVDFFENPKASTGQFEIMHEYKIKDIKRGRIRKNPFLRDSD